MAFRGANKYLSHQRVGEKWDTGTLIEWGREPPKLSRTKRNATAETATSRLYSIEGLKSLGPFIRQLSIDKVLLTSVVTDAVTKSGTNGLTAWCPRSINDDGWRTERTMEGEEPTAERT
ncbi:hypothetical protein EVAR_18475_1 [Eumeta japonica]|uniref:Uncharacterized protein n=1 Tax=Eumeta variegata TaxID=151549 RepID=A0A4C1V0Y2_EUMVA|nr:hypothetical protein EVAR_18475_1 [Eumeta japonica]